MLGNFEGFLRCSNLKKNNLKFFPPKLLSYQFQFGSISVSVLTRDHYNAITLKKNKKCHKLVTNAPKGIGLV